MAHMNDVAPADKTAETREWGERSIVDPAQRPPTSRFGFSAIWRGAPRIVGLAVLLNAAIMVLSIFAWPPNRSPDELAHVDMIAAVARGTAVPWPAPAKLHSTFGDKASVVMAAGCRCEPLRAQDAPAAWPSWNDAGGDKPTVHINWMVEHPPVYYGVMAAALKVFPNWRNHPYNVVLAYLKLVNLVFILPLPLLAWAAARRFTGNRTVGATAAVGAVLIPHVQHVGSSINNDNLLVFEGALLAVLLAHVVRGDTSRRTGIFVGLTLTVALLTKGTALVFMPWALLAYLMAWRRTRSAETEQRRFAFRRSVVPAAIALVGSAVLGGWWWVHNKIAYGVVQVNGSITDQHASSHKRVLTTLADSGVHFTIKLVQNMIITYWLDTTQRPIPDDIGAASLTLTAIAAIVLLIGILRAFVKLPGRGSGALELHRLDVLFLVAVPLMIFFIVFQGSWGVWRTTLVAPGQQGRYLNPGLIGVLILLAVGLWVLAGRRSVLLTTIAVGITQLMMGIALVWTYWLPRGRPVTLGLFADAWHTMVVWSALNTPAMAVLVLLVVASFVALVWEAARFQVDEPGPPAAPASPSAAHSLPVTVAG